MGQRTSSETVVAIIVAFWRQRVWSQADLARECGVSARAVRRHLEALSAAGWPFEREDDHPHVYWSVPKAWFPGGMLLEPSAVASLVSLLMRVPSSVARGRLLKVITDQTPNIVVEALQRVVPPRSTEVEEKHLPTLLDSLADDVPLRLRYWTARSGTLSSRTVSVQRVLVGPPTRFVAWCHTARELRWFRLDYVSDAGTDTTAVFHHVADGQVEALISESVDGYHGEQRLRIAFFVRDPDARWVAMNLPDGLSGTTEDGGLLVEAETTGLLPVARFVVGLGGAAECRTPELAKLVQELASGALANAKQE